MHITFRADKTVSAYMYINIKVDDVWTPRSTLTLIVETPVMFATYHISMVNSYVKEKLQTFHEYRSFRAVITTTFYIYIIKKWQSLNAKSDLDLSRRNPSLVRHTLYICGYFIYERKKNPVMHVQVSQRTLPQPSIII
jgi:hypothetical protein